MQRYRPFSLKEGHGMSDVTNEPIRFGDYILYSDFVSYTDFGKEIIVEKEATIASLTERVRELEEEQKNAWQAELQVIRNLNEEKFALQKKVKKYEDDINLTEAALGISGIYARKEEQIDALELRNRELEEALEKIASSDGINSDFSQFDVRDIESPAFTMARDIAKKALRGNPEGGVNEIKPI
jgi:cysteinyl-tRNA synthetase